MIYPKGFQHGLPAHQNRGIQNRISSNGVPEFESFRQMDNDDVHHRHV